MQEIIFLHREIQSKTVFKYNANGQLKLEIYKSDFLKIEKSYIYNELEQLVNIKYKFTNYDSNGLVTDEYKREAPREYKNNQLVKEWEYWGGFNTYEYADGKVIKKIDYTKQAEKHHITTYRYSDDLLIEEKKETRAGRLMYLKTYIYDSKKRLIKIRDRENIIEENSYLDKKLIEKKTYYFGIDPGYFPCYGNYIYKYEYQAS